MASRVHTVGKSSRYDYQELAEALSELRPGDELQIAPGHYKGSMIITTPNVKLTALKHHPSDPGTSRSDVVLESGDQVYKDVITIIADGVYISNLVIRGPTVAPPPQVSHDDWPSCVEICAEDVRVENCQIMGYSRGVVFREKALQGVLENCTLTALELCAVIVEGGGATIANCQIHNCGHTVVHPGVRVRLYDCKSRDNEDSGIFFQGAETSSQRSKLRCALSSSIHGGEFSGNKGFGIESEEAKNIMKAKVSVAQRFKAFSNGKGDVSDPELVASVPNVVPCTTATNSIDSHNDQDDIMAFLQAKRQALRNSSSANAPSTPPSLLVPSAKYDAVFTRNLEKGVPQAYVLLKDYYRTHRPRASRKVSIGLSPGRGNGLFAKVEIFEDDEVIKYSGMFGEQREDAENRYLATWALRREEHGFNQGPYDIDAEYGGNEARFINGIKVRQGPDREEANVYAESEVRQGKRVIVLYAERDIQCGEEFFWDYVS
ncbi:hypothetical protein CYMTET_20553 [Cymbomonas tetramitiformis]|uniref:SET domain-containing protein n=1 Tax=Cymbomonas tetramitiformis TaxID=36881 RepID=A0AAE0G431_9CHLO|nr:hypothetical protein CYMTET_20553 [Cymbomonas tetramitiformis]